MKVTCINCHGSGKMWCPACNGNKTVGGKKCWNCDGDGIKICNYCMGTGKMDKSEADDYRR